MNNNPYDKNYTHPAETITKQLLTWCVCLPMIVLAFMFCYFYRNGGI